jgi:nucleotide-binding universal stress UspA family protein
MKTEELRSQLEKLHNELHQSQALDLQQRELLQTLADEIQALLKRDEIQRHHYMSLSERLNDAVAELEASHPDITLLMRQTIDSLAYLGI